MRADDDPRAVAANRAALRERLPQDPVWLKQVHGARVVRADAVTDSPEADAAYTRRAETVCAVMVADCMPVLLCDTQASVVAIAHAGWRGLSAGVIENTIAAMGVKANELLAFLGPAIGPAAFEVGARRARCVSCRRRRCRGRIHAAPRTENGWRTCFCSGASASPARACIASTAAGCARISDPARFYSYRRDRTTGRMAALIWLADA